MNDRALVVIVREALRIRELKMINKDNINMLTLRGKLSLKEQSLLQILIRLCKDARDGGLYKDDITENEIYFYPRGPIIECLNIYMKREPANRDHEISLMKKLQEGFGNEQSQAEHAGTEGKV